VVRARVGEDQGETRAYRFGKRKEKAELSDDGEKKVPRDAGSDETVLLFVLAMISNGSRRQTT
jgi:hypothetical protein